MYIQHPACQAIDLAYIMSKPVHTVWVLVEWVFTAAHLANIPRKCILFTLGLAHTNLTNNSWALLPWWCQLMSAALRPEYLGCFPLDQTVCSLPPSLSQGFVGNVSSADPIQGQGGNARILVRSSAEFQQMLCKLGTPQQYSRRRRQGAWCTVQFSMCGEPLLYMRRCMQKFCVYYR
jgi:hypothetical protein